jgi:hypothetical protein
MNLVKNSLEYALKKIRIKISRVAAKNIRDEE